METFECRKCGESFPREGFSPHSGCKFGIDRGRCLICKNEEGKASYHKSTNEQKIFNRAKSRATRKGWEFTIELSDIKIPELCPVFKQPLIYGDTDWTPSIDRINPALGYIKGNICIISNRANRIKNDASMQELQAVVSWMETL